MLKVGVAGVGKFGENHARILCNSDKCNFLGIFDADQNRAQAISEKYDMNIYQDFEQMLADIDVLFVIVTTISHFDLAQKALTAGVHVFIEKPITSELWQAEKLIEIAEKRNLKIQVGHIERFNPVIMKIEKKIKDPLFIECHRIAPFTPRGSDVPVVLELMIHDIDLILSFIKSKVKKISASGASVMTSKIDIANARLEFENSAVANVTSSRISLKRSRQIRFFQKDAYFSVDFQSQKVKSVSKSKQIYKVLPKIMMGNYEGIKTEDVVDITKIDASDQKKDALTTELEAFLFAIEKDQQPIVDGKAGLRALEVAFKIMKKIKQK